MTNTELRKEAEKYIEENNIVSNTYEIEKAFIDGAKFLRDKAVVNNCVLDDVINSFCPDCGERGYKTNLTQDSYACKNCLAQWAE